MMLWIKKWVNILYFRHVEGKLTSLLDVEQKLASLRDDLMSRECTVQMGTILRFLSMLWVEYTRKDQPKNSRKAYRTVTKWALDRMRWNRTTLSCEVRGGMRMVKLRNQMTPATPHPHHRGSGRFRSKSLTQQALSRNRRGITRRP